MKLSITEGGKEGKSKVITSCKYLEEVPGIQRERRSCLGNKCRNTGSGFGTRTRQLGAKEKARRKMCDVRFSLIRDNRVFQENYMRIGVRKLLRVGLVRAGVWGG